MAGQGTGPTQLSGMADLALTPDADSNDFYPYERVSSGQSVIDTTSVNEFGRTFHGYKDGKYLLPNDGLEQERLDIHHQCQKTMLDDKLNLAPIGDNFTGRVLDIATGTGIWANEFADLHPKSTVVGTDFSMIQPSVHPNCTFVVEDAEEYEWTLGDKFDYIHMRLVALCFDNPERVAENCFKNLHDGGWVEIQDPDLTIVSADGSSEGTTLERWLQLVEQGLASRGRDSRIGRKWKGILEDAGFVDIREVVIPWVWGGWPADKKWKIAGSYAALGFDERALEGWSVKPLKAAGLSNAEVRDVVKGTVRDIRDNSIHALCPYHIVCGRKPREIERAEGRATGA